MIAVIRLRRRQQQHKMLNMKSEGGVFVMIKAPFHRCTW
jgi:hypothetical protein